MRKFLVLMLASMSVMLLGVHAAVAQGTMKTEVGDGEGALDIVAWVGYVERGDTDKSYDWVTGFEADTGCKVNVKVAATSDRADPVISTSADSSPAASS